MILYWVSQTLLFGRIAKGNFETFFQYVRKTMKRVFKVTFRTCPFCTSCCFPMNIFSFATYANITQTKSTRDGVVTSLTYSPTSVVKFAGRSRQ